MKSVIPSLVSCLFVSAILFFAPSHAVFSQVPEIENAIPKNLPLKVEIIAPEKAEDYPDKIRIKVTNTGDVPVVWLRLHLEEITEEVRIAPDGKRAFVTMPLEFGSSELNSSYMELPSESDPSIAIGGEYIFLVPKYYKRVKEKRMESANYRPVLNYRLAFRGARMLDGSGYFSSGQSFSKKN